jgi:gliding motility-associated-like protein
MKKNIVLAILLFVSEIAFGQLPCNNWLATPSLGSTATLGDIDITGNQLTIEANYNRNQPLFNGLYPGHLISKHTDATNNNYSLFPNGCALTTTNGYVQTFENCVIQVNKNYHVAMVYDGTTLKFYRNGFLQSAKPCSGNLIINNLPTTIAQTSGGNVDITQFLGNVNEVRIWKKARTQAEIQTYMNDTLPNPTSQNGLVAYYTFNSLKNKQGSATFDGILQGGATINETNTNCNFVVDSCEILPTPIASFTVPDTVCVNTPITISNTSTGATTYNWSFCNANLNTTPVATNLGNIGGNLSLPVFIDYVFDNGNYYGFIINHTGSIVRLDFGNSLLNTPTSINLGNIGGALSTPTGNEGIQIIKQGGKYFIYVNGGSPQVGNRAQIVRYEFGTNITNTNPITTVFANIGNMDYPGDLFAFSEGNNWYVLTTNNTNNTLMRYNLTNNLTNPITAINLGNIGGLLKSVSGINVINDNGFWRLFIINQNANPNIVRLDFGNSLLNTPTAVDLGNPNNILKAPRDILLTNTCNGIVGYIVDGIGGADNNLIRLNFSALYSITSTNNLGNIGNFKFPHSLSKLFKIGNDAFTFIPNVANNTLTRLEFPGCTNSSIPSSSSQTPPQISYNTVGSYNINVTIDEGLPTQASYCKQIVVKNCNIPCTNKPDFSFIQNTCTSSQITFKNETPNTSSFNWNFGNSTTNNTNQNPIVNYANYANYNVQLIVMQTNGCLDTVIKSIPVTTQFVDGLIKQNDTTICLGSSIKLNVQDSGLAYCWRVSNGVANNTTASQIVAPTSNTTYYYNTQTVGNNLVINGDFEQGNTGFQSDYTYKTPPRTSQGQYYIGNNPNSWFNPFVACKDHTTSTGNMIMLDGSTTVNSAIWKQNIAILPNTNYVFSGWVQSIVAQDPARLQFKINGNQLGATITAITTACNWSKYTILWNSGSNTTANLSITNNNLVVQGNDFAIDDIVFAPVEIKTDSVNVVVNNCSLVCKGVVELHGHDKIVPPQANFTKYFPSTGFTWETWFNGSYFDNNNTSIDTRCKLIAATDLPLTQDIVLGFGWPNIAQKKELCFLVDGPNGQPDRDNNPCKYFPLGGFLPNTWYHVAAVKDYIKNTTSLYINGALVDSKPNVHSPLKLNSNILLPNFYFGSMTGVGNTDSGFAGKMDEIRIWNTVRSASEINTNFNKCLVGNETGLVAYYHSSEKTGSILHDVSPNANNATLGNGVVLNKNENAPIINPCFLQTNSTTNATICQGQSFWGHSTAGQHTDILVNVLGCDSIRVVNLTITTSKKDTINKSICFGTVYLTHTTSGIYFLDSTRLPSGCDSISYLNLTVLSKTITTKDTLPSACNSVFYNGQFYTKDTLITLPIIKNILGCDSIITQHQIFITQNKKDTFSIAICNLQNYLGHTVSGVYKTDSFRLSSGCDSLRFVNLVVDAFIKDSIKPFICFGDTFNNKYTTSGIYFDTIKATFLCDSIRKITLTVRPKLQPTLINDASMCQGDTLALYPGKFYFYQWNTGSHLPQIIIKDTGTYWVLIKDSLGCKATDSFNLISLYKKPHDFLQKTISKCIGELFTIDKKYITYKWNTGETTPTISLAGLNSYWLTVSDSNGCKATNTMKVVYINAQNIELVNAFSPNGDGINDIFKPFEVVCATQFSLTIFNRYGQQVWQTLQANTHWNGTYNGNPLPVGVYYYIVNYTNLLGIKNTKSGFITLLK